MVMHMRRAWVWASALGAAVVLTACDDAKEPQATASAFVFPNAEWVGEDGRLRQAKRGVATTAFGEPVDFAELLAQSDGFSLVQPMLVPTVGGCPDLPQPFEEAESVADTSPVVVVDRATATRIPWFGEPGEDPTICELYPLAPFSEGGEVLVVVTTSFAAELPADTFGLDPDHGAAGVDSGLAPSQIRAAFRFRVGTIRNRIAPMFALRDAAMAWLEAQAQPLLLEVHPYGSPISDALLTWGGTYRVPLYLNADGVIEFDDAGLPVLQGESMETFYAIANPEITATVNAPVVQYGHGLFGDPSELLAEGTRMLREVSGGLWAAVPWGMATRYFHRAAAGILQPGEIILLRDRVWQSLVNKMVFTRVLRTEIAPLVETTYGVDLADVVDYLGISQGGILGGVLMGLSPELRRGALHVGGGGWTSMMTHSSNWTGRDDPEAAITGLGFGDVLAETVPDASERTLLLALWQVLWDAWDPVLYAPFWLRAPEWAPAQIPAGRGVHYTYAIADPQVPNYSSDLVLRASGTPLLTPSIYSPFGVELVTFDAGPFATIAQQWDVGPGEPAHVIPRMLRPWAEGVVEFLTQGTLSDTCGGRACRFDPDTKLPLP